MLKGRALNANMFNLFQSNDLNREFNMFRNKLPVIGYLFIILLSKVVSLPSEDTINVHFIGNNEANVKDLKPIVRYFTSDNNSDGTLTSDSLNADSKNSKFIIHTLHDPLNTSNTNYFHDNKNVHSNSNTTADLKSFYSNLKTRASINPVNNKSEYFTENNENEFAHSEDNKSNFTTGLSRLGKNDSFNSVVMKVLSKKNKIAKDHSQDVDPNSRVTSSKRQISVNKTDPDIFLPVYLAQLDDAIENMEDGVCKEHCNRVLHGIRSREQWALQMYDASAKIPEGVLWGMTYQMGNYDECLDVQLSTGDGFKPLIRGQYCLANIALNMTHIREKYGIGTDPLIETFGNKDRNYERHNLHWAVCIPSSCTEKEVEYLMGHILRSSSASYAPLSIDIPSNMCSYQKEKYFREVDVAFACIICFFILLVFASTIFHCIRIYSENNFKTDKSTLNELIISFSVVQNMKKIISVKSNNENSLDYISGIRCIAMMFIISGHSLLFIASAPVQNDGFWKQAITQVENAFLLNNPLLVDTFLLLSGFLMCLLLLVELEKRKGRLNFIFIYVGRYIRLTPAYAVVLGFYLTWMVHINNGPLWNSRMLVEQERCSISWWANLLYVNNYVSTDNLCMFQSWYLSVDTQLFILAPLIIYPLWKWPKFGQFLLAIITTTSIVVPFIITYVEDLDATFFAYAPEVRDLAVNSYFINAYVKTHMRASAYCFGLLLGYIIFRIQSSTKFEISRPVFWWCSSLAAVVGILSMYTVSVFYQPSYVNNALSNAAYNGLHRVGWCLAMSWIIVACVTNNGGPVKKFLCWKFFQPLSRLTYCAYLTNGFVVLFSAAVVRSPQYLSIYNLVCHSFAHVFISFGLALILCLFFESPIHGIEKILLRRDKSKNPTEEASLAEA